MKLRQRKQNKNIFLALLAAVVLIGGLCYFYFSLRSNSDENNSSITSQRQSDGDTKSKEEDGGTAEQNKNSEPKETKEEKVADNESGYVNIPYTPPAPSEAYPVRNEFYKIETSNEKNFTVTLYPIVNDPRDPSYPVQLREYKKRALDYLKKRYSDTSKLSIKWIPDVANEL